MAQASERPALLSSALDSAGWWDERSLFADITSYTLVDDEGIDMTELVTASSTGGDLEAHADATFEPFFKAIDESFDLFDLELEFCMDLSSSSLEPLAILSDFSSQATAIPLTTTELSSREPECPQPQPKKRKKSLKTSSQRDGQQPQSKKRKPSLKTSSQRQREEIESLRATATQLEDQLQVIRAVTVQGSSSASIQSCSTGDARTESQSLWECVARRQEAERRQAEQTNAALRKHIQTNLKLATSLEQSLRCKRESSDA